MRSGKLSHQVSSAVLLLHLIAGTAGASPLSTSGDPTALPAEPAWAPASAEQLVQSDSWIDTSPSVPLLVPSPPPGEAVRESPGTATATSWDAANTIATPLPGLGLSEQLREFVQVEARRPGAAQGPGPGPGQWRSTRSGPGDPDIAGIDLGAAAEAWIRETMQSLIHATLRLEVSESGRPSFSVLGFGEFTITLSSDRSQIALAEGDDVLLVAQRSQENPGSRSGAGRASVGAPFETLSDEPEIWRAIALVADIASHPVSLLVYCVIAAYLLLWSMLSRQQQARDVQVPMVAGGYSSADISQVSIRRHRKPRRRSSSRLAHTSSERTPNAEPALIAGPRSMTNPSIAEHANIEPATVKPATTDPAAIVDSAPAKVRRRKRIRVRIRTRTRRTLSSHRA